MVTSPQSQHIAQANMVASSPHITAPGVIRIASPHLSAPGIRVASPHLSAPGVPKLIVKFGADLTPGMYKIYQYQYFLFCTNFPRLLLL